MKILVSDSIAEQGVARLQAAFSVDVKVKLPGEELIKIIPAYDGLVVRSETKVTRDVIAAASRLKVIGRAGVGVDNIDVDAATNCGIIVLNAPEGNTVAATEHTIAMLLALARNIPQAHASLKAGEWQRSKFMGVEMRGKVLGIIGLGRIGTGVAVRAQALEMKVIAYDPFISAERAANLNIELADVGEILARADYVTLHTPLTKDTKHLINAVTLGRAKRGIRIVNCARGGIIDEQALYQALVEGRVAGAALDVFEQEPLPADSPLLKLPNVIVTPHLGASTAEAQVNVALDVAEGIIAVLKGEPVRTAVNIAPVPPEVLARIRPYLALAEKMGTLAVQLVEGRIMQVEVAYSGEIAASEVHPITTAGLKGLLNPLLQEKVNDVNAPIVAKRRGISVTEVRTTDTGHFANLITLKVHTDRGETTVAGTLFGKNDPRIVRINNYRVDAVPAGWLLIGPHIDQPGMIGQVGTILGNSRINIASMQVGRTARTAGGTSIMVLGVDSTVPGDILARIKAVDGILDMKLVNLNGI